MEPISELQVDTISLMSLQDASYSLFSALLCCEIQLTSIFSKILRRKRAKVKSYGIIAICLLALLLVSSLYAQESQRPTGVRVLGVRVEGTATADPGLVVANSGIVVGNTIYGEDIQRAIRRIWALNMFGSIDILIERETSAGAFFLIRVLEYPRLETVEVRGNRKMNRTEIMETLNLYMGQVLRPSRIQRAQRDLQRLYEEKGYLLAEATFEVIDTDDEMQKTLRIEIDEGSKVKIREITFEGNNAFTDGKLRKQLRHTKERGFFRSGSFDRVEYEEDLEELITFYRNHGYRDARVVGDSISYTEDRRRMLLNIEIDEGPLYYFGDIEFEGNTLFGEEELLSQLEFRPGDPYSEERLTYTTAERLGSLYYDRGYIYSQIQPVEIPRMAVSDSTNDTDTLDIHFTIMEGNQFRVRQIHILGNTKTKERVIRREFMLYPGETFDVSKLRRSIRDVTILNYFANIEPDVQQVAEDEVDLYVTVEEKPTDQANVSAGYSERDGMIGAVGFAMPNLFGNGQRFSLDWNFGRIYRSFSISFTEPWLLNTPTLAGVSFFDLRRGGSYYGYDESVTGASFRLGRRFRWPDDYTRGDIIYRIDRALYDNFSESFRETNPRGIEEGVPRYSSSVTAIVTRDSRDNPEFPSRGSVHSYSLELAGSFLGGDDQFIKHNFSSEWYFPVTSKLVLYSQTRYGVIYSLHGEPDDIPYIDYFFMGGSGISFGESLRGYEDREVGPQTSVGGYSIGGSTLFKQTIEMRIPLVPNPTVFGLVFFDAGNVWLTPSETDFSNLRRSAGFGMRLFMPLIGLIGLDYGYGFDYIDSSGRRKGEWVPHFQFGRTF